MQLWTMLQRLAQSSCERADAAVIESAYDGSGHWSMPWTVSTKSDRITERLCTASSTKYTISINTTSEFDAMFQTFVTGAIFTASI